MNKIERITGINNVRKTSMSDNINDNNLYPAPIKKIGGTKWGYINKKGNYELEPIYDYAENFQNNNLAIILINEEYAVIDKNGNYIIGPLKGTIDGFSEGRAIIRCKNGSKMINEAGNVLFEIDGFINSLYEGRSVFTQKSNIPNDYTDRYGYLDKDGNIVIPAKYKYASSFRNGKAIVKIDENNYALIDPNGEILNTYDFYYMTDIGEGLIIFSPYLSDGYYKFGFVDEEGTVIIPPRFDGAQIFQQGRSVVSIRDDYNYYSGLIDKNGKWIIDPKYSDIRIIGKNRAAVGIPANYKNPDGESKYAIYDLDGNKLSDFNYYDITDYKNGYASVNDGKKTFFIDANGKMVDTLPIFEGIGAMFMENGVIYSIIEKRRIYLLPTGDIIWNEEGNIKLNDQYAIQEEKYKPVKNYIVYYPQISGIKDSGISKMVNAKLRQIAIVEEIEKDIQLDFTYESDYDAIYFSKKLVVINILGYQYYYGAAHGMPIRDCVHIDLETGRFYKLRDLFKKSSDYVKIISDIIKKQIIEQGEHSLVQPENFNKISPDQTFFIKDNALNIYFSPYEIAPYAAGFPTFKIPFSEISNIIDTNGEFWKAFSSSDNVTKI